MDRAAFLGKQPQFTADDLDYVCQTYFIKQADITDYDTIGNIGEPQPLS